jgi:hypothetical protein
MIDSILITLQNFILYVLDRIGVYVGQLIQSVTSWVSELTRFLTTSITRVMDALTAWLNGFATQLANFFSSLMARIEGIFTQLWNRTIGALVETLDRVATWVNSVIQDMRALFAFVVSEVGTFVDEATARVKALIQGAIEWIGETATSILASVRAAVTTAVAGVEAFVAAIVSRVSAGIDALVGSASVLIATVNDRIAGIGSAFADAVGELVQGLTGLAEEQVRPIRELLESQLKLFTDATGPEGVAEMQAAYAEYVSPNSLHITDRRSAAEFWTSLTPRNRVSRWIFLMLANVLVFWTTFSGVATAGGAIALQEFALTYPHQLLSPADVSAAWRKGIVSREHAVLTIRKGGYTAEDAERILEITETLPAPGDILTMRNRGIITDETARAGLRAHGIHEPWAGHLITASSVVPPLQDVITMAVRDVFTPEVAERFGQFQEYPAELTTWAKAHGLSEEWAKRYWAAHWSLPSATQGFEMVHRGAAEEEDLDKLLRALDVMPFWREPLKAITYLPFTRVDIRRMHKMGILDEEAVLRAHLDLGYNAEKAEALTRFTLEMNGAGDEGVDVELGKLTRTGVLDFYEDGSIERDRAVALLIGLGNTADAAELYVQSSDLRIERAARKESVQLILDRYAAGAVTQDEAVGQLTALNLTGREIQRAIVGLESRKASGTKLPSRTEAEAMVKAGALDAEGYVELLSRLGYAPVWARRFLAVLEGKLDAAAE